MKRHRGPADQTGGCILGDDWEWRAIPIRRNGLVHKTEYSGRDIIQLAAIMLHRGIYIGASGKIKSFKSVVAAALRVFFVYHKGAVSRRVHL